MLLLGYVTCGGTITKLNSVIPELTSLIVNIIKIGVPVILVILGMMDLFKAMTAQKEDEIKKAQGIFFKRLVAGILVFFVFVIVELVFNVLSDVVDASGTNNKNIWECAECFISGPDDQGKNGSPDNPADCRKK